MGRLGFSIAVIVLGDQSLFSIFIYTHLFSSALLCNIIGKNEYFKHYFCSKQQLKCYTIPYFTLQLNTESSNFAFLITIFFQHSFRHSSHQNSCSWRSWSRWAMWVHQFVLSTVEACLHCQLQTLTGYHHNFRSVTS